MPDIWLLDSAFRKINVIENFESFIWTERYNGMGDFQLVVEDNLTNRSLYTKDKFISYSDSQFVMAVELGLGSNSNGKHNFQVRGRTIDKGLKHRVFGMVFEGWRPYQNDKNKDTTRDYPNPFEAVKFKVTSGTGYGDHYGPVGPGTELKDDLRITTYSNQSTVSTTCTIDGSVENLYDGVTKLLDTYDLGYKLIPLRVYNNSDNSNLIFIVYSGKNRRSNQTVNTPVIFDPDLENLDDVESVWNLQDYYNIAYVSQRVVPFNPQNPDAGDWGPVAGGPGQVQELVRYGVAVGATSTRFWDRRVLYVDGTDIAATGSKLTRALTNRGNAALKEHRRTRSVTGKVINTGLYQYGRDYALGDIVTLRGLYDDTDSARVTEYTYSITAEGSNGYPTLEPV